MHAKLPAALTGYFAAANEHDVSNMTAAFGPDAVVKDENQEYHGSAAIRGWIEETIRKYDFELEPTEVAEHHGQTVVTCLVSGRFPGSPIRLRYSFTLNGSKIVRLEIG